MRKLQRWAEVSLDRISAGIRNNCNFAMCWQEVKTEECFLRVCRQIWVNSLSSVVQMCGQLFIAWYNGWRSENNVVRITFARDPATQPLLWISSYRYKYGYEACTVLLVICFSFTVHKKIFTFYPEMGYLQVWRCWMLMAFKKHFSHPRDFLGDSLRCLCRWYFVLQRNPGFFKFHYCGFWLFWSWITLWMQSSVI